jgi:hypothetical protein
MSLTILVQLPTFYIVQFAIVCKYSQTHALIQGLTVFCEEVAFQFFVRTGILVSKPLQSHRRVLFVLITIDVRTLVVPVLGFELLLHGDDDPVCVSRVITELFQRFSTLFVGYG